MELIQLLILLLLPGGFWLYFFAGDKQIFQSTPRALLPTFVLGIFVCMPALAIEYFCVIVTQLVENSVTVLISSFLIIAPLEEYLKSLAVDIGGYSRREEGNSRQILAWYFAAAIGFASIENVLYFIVFGPRIFYYRILLTTLAHVACSGLMGLFVGAYAERKASGFVRGFFIATVLHGAYDYTLNLYQFSIWLWVPLFFLIAGFLESRLEKPTTPASDPDIQT